MRSTLKVNILVLLVVLVAGLIPAAAQTAPQESLPSVDKIQESLPSVDKIVEKYVGALGGKAAIEKLTSRVAKGTFEMDQMPGTASEEIYQKAPNKQLGVTDSPNFGVVRFGFNGTVGWQDMPQTGLQDVTGTQLTAMKRNADFYRELKLKETYPKMIVKGKESVNGHDAYVVEATPADGPAELMYFDVDSGLLVRIQAQEEGPSGTGTVETTFDDYREVDGIKLPFVIRQSRSEFSFVIRLTEVKHNVPIEDAKFDKPTP